jgi:hypothetical protein
LDFLGRPFQRKPRGRNVVAFDEDRIIRPSPDGRTEIATWIELQEVEIMTTDEGPFAEDVYWMLKATSGRCAVPGKADGMNELLSRLQQLPGFQNEAVIEAMGSTNNATFVCRSRENAL